MANLLKGKEVANAINERNKKLVEELKAKGVTPTLAVFRLGEKQGDLSYEKGIDKRSAEVGINVVKYVFDEDVSEEEFYNKLDEANNNNDIHGILVFRPLPKRFDDKKLRNYINSQKDVDGCGDMSLAGVFTNTEVGFAPCTAQAAMEVLDYYGIDVKGKNVVVIGRSLVIGKPVSMLLLNANATITICHTKTKDIEAIASKAEILILATGKSEMITKDYVNPNQVIIDIGVSFNEEKQKLTGDANFDEVEPIVDSITPVPGGVGSVTTSVLIDHVVKACVRAYEK